MIITADVSAASFTGARRPSPGESPARDASEGEQRTAGIPRGGPVWYLRAWYSPPTGNVVVICEVVEPAVSATAALSTRDPGIGATPDPLIGGGDPPCPAHPPTAPLLPQP